MELGPDMVRGERIPKSTRLQCTFTKDQPETHSGWVRIQSVRNLALRDSTCHIQHGNMTLLCPD